MRIFLKNPFSYPVLYRLQKARSITGPYFEILHVYETLPFKSIIGLSHNVCKSHYLQRFDATHYLTEDHKQCEIAQEILRTFNYILPDNVRQAHFTLPHDVKPHDRLLLV